MSRPTILVLRALGLGDLLTGLPALAMLRAARPDHDIVLATPTWFDPLVRLAGSVDRVVHAHELSPITDPPSRPDLAVDLHGNGPESVRLLQACDPREILAFATPSAPRWYACEHEVARWCRLLAEGLPINGAAAPSVVGSLAVPDLPDVPSGVSVLHCGAKSRARQWPPARFAELARRLTTAGHRVVVTGASNEAPIAALIARESGTRSCTDLGLLELAALIAHARLVVSGDTGVAHLASAYATPSVTLFGPVSPMVWGPPDEQWHQVLAHGAGNGDPHGNTPDPALLRIDVDAVERAAHRADRAGDERAQPALSVTGWGSR
jgi:ADP-heptose:LPS heptosyltransferase